MAEKKVFYTLDGLRGVAALAIVVMHSPELFGAQLAPSSGLAVDLFFVLSGFVIAHAYDERFRAGMTALEFMRIRFIRLYPLYILGTFLGLAVIGAGLVMHKTDWSWETYLRAIPASLVMLPTPFPGALYPLNVVAWSLFFELVANLVYAVFWPLFQKRWLLLVWLGLAAVAVAVTTAIWRDLGNGPEWPAVAGLARVAYGFWMGILLFRLRAGRRDNAVVPWLLLAVLPLIFHQWFSPTGQIIYEVGCSLALLPAIVYAGAAFDPTVGAKAFRFLGLTSYAIYVLHKPLVIGAFSVVDKILHVKLGPPLTPWLGIGFVILVLAGCWLADKVYDAPVRRWLTSRTRKT